MRLAEFDGKALLRRHGLAVPRGVLLRPGESRRRTKRRSGPAFCSRRRCSKAAAAKAAWCAGFADRGRFSATRGG